MDTNQLRYFLAVLDNGSFQSASKSLGITQSAITKSVARLEEYLGVILLERGRHGASPTALGATYAVRARAICAEEVSAKTEITDLLHSNHGRVRLGMGIAFANGLVPQAIRAFRKLYSQATLTVNEGMSPELFDELRRGHVDFVISSPIERSAQDILEFNQTYLFNDSDVIVASQSHPLAKLERVTFSDLRNYPWVISERVPELRQLIWRKFREENVAPPDHIILSDSVQLAKSLVAEEDYLVILGKEFIKYEVANNVLCALPVDDFTPHRSAYICHRRGFELEGASRKFFDILVQLSRQSYS